MLFRSGDMVGDGATGWQVQWQQSHDREVHEMRTRCVELLELGCLQIVAHALPQNLVQVVKSQAVNVVRVDEHLIGSPFEASSFGIRHPGISTDDEQAEEPNVSMSEISRKSLGLLEIVERIEPVNQLAEAVF